MNIGACWDVLDGKESDVARKVNVEEGARRRLAQHEHDVAVEVAAAAAPEVDQAHQDTGVLVPLPVTAIAPDPGNPRKDLAGLDGLVASIEQYGVLQPVTVRPADPGEDLPEGVRYVLVMGERRHTAAGRAGLEKIPAVVRSTVAADRLPVQLLENLQRQALSPIEEAVAYQALIDQGLSQREISRRLGVSQPHVHRRISLLGMDPAALELVASGRLSVDVAANDVARLDLDLQRLWAQEVTAESASEAAMVPGAEDAVVISPAEARAAIAKVLRQHEREVAFERQKAWAAERGIEAMDERREADAGDARWIYVADPDETAAQGRRVAILDRWGDDVPDVYDLVERTEEERTNFDAQVEQREQRRKDDQRREKELRRAIDRLISSGDVPPKTQMLPLMARWMLRRAHAIDTARVRKALGDKVKAGDEYGWETKVSIQDAYRLVAGLLIVSDAERARHDPEAQERISARLDALEPGLGDRLLGEAGAE